MSNAIANRYEILASLGEGGMGKVLSVRDTVTDRDVALKLVHGTGAAALQQLKHEFWTMTRLRHPHTVEVYDYGALEDGTPYFTMEIVAGQGLDEALPMSASAVREVLAGLCRALSFIHAQGYVHGDLKPENVRLTTGGQVKLMDFGLMERAGRAGGPIRGTLLYLAPEVARGGRVDQRADLYALGAVAFHLLTGFPPYQAASTIDLIKSHLDAPVPTLTDKAAGIDPALEALVMRLMAKDPLKRYQSAGEVLEALGYDAEEVGTTLLEPSFIGRAEALGRFEGMLGAEGGLVLVEGGAGSGKTRLGQEFHLVAQLAEQATAAVRAPEQAAPYAPIVEALRALLPLARTLCPALLDTHAPVLSRLLPELGTGEAPEALEPQQEKMRLQGAVSDVLGAIARSKGLVLLIDDAQWLDEPSRELCDHLLRNSQQAPLFLVLVGGSPATEPVQRFSAENLSAEEATRMIASMLGTEKLAPEFLEPVLEVSAGNPRYLNDLLHYLVESGMLVKQNGAWQTEGGFNLAALPSDLHGLMGQKIDALGPEAIAVARAVSVAGGGTRLALLSALPDLPQDESLFQAIGELEAEGVLELGPTGYEFSHHQIASLVYGSLGESERKALHGHVAEALLPELAEKPADVALLNAVATHLLEGEEPQRAVPFALRAGERNLDLFANAQARKYFEAGLRHQDDTDPGLKLRYLVGLGDVARRQGDQKEASAALDEALVLAERLGDKVLVSRILSSQGKIHQTAGQYDQAKEALRRAAEVAEEAGATRDLGRALTTLGRITYFGGDVPATIEVFSRALAVAREANVPVYLAESLAFLGYLFASDPERQEEGLAYLQESLVIKQGLGDKIGLNDTTMLLGNAYLALGRYSEANECFLQCQQINAEIGQTDELIFGHLNLAIVAFEMGDVQEALRLAELAAEGAIATNSRYAEGMAVTLSGIARLYLGQLGTGMAEVDRGLALAREMNNRYLEVTIAVYRSDALLQLGRLAEAAEYAKAALAMTEETGVREIIPQQQVMLGLAQLLTGEREAARLTLTTARKAADASNARGISAKAMWALALVASHSKDYATAQQLAHDALQDADEIGARYLSAQAHALLGELKLVQDHRSLAVEHLRKALNLAEGIGSPLLHGRILRLLAEADPLRGDSLQKIANNEADRLFAGLAEGDRPAFESGWFAPWVPRAQGIASSGLSVEARLGKVGGELADILAQLRGESAQRQGSQKSQERLEQLIDFALKINQVHDLQLVLEMAMDLIIGIAEAERGFLLLYKEGEIQVSQLRNIRGEEEADWLISRSVAEEVLRTEQPICLQDALSDDRFSHSQSVQELNVRTVLCVPLKIRNVVVGSLYVDRQSIGNGFSEGDLDVVMSLAALTATAIENANLHHEWDDKSRKLEMLNSLSRTISTTLVMEEVLDLVVQLTLEVTTAERGFLLLWEQDRLSCRAAFKRGGERLDPEAQAISQSICQRVLDSGESLCVEDASADEHLQVQASIMALNLRTVMCVPLIAKQTVLGLLYVDSQAIVNHFTERDLELLEAIANHASVAIENAHLYTQLARRANELENLVMLYEEANLRASTDALTGLHNRRFFQDQLNRDFAQARRHRRHLSVIMLDIDHFKSFNDTFGHALGDQVLQSVSVVLGQAVRLADVVARYGGEEFIVSLPDTDFEGALIVADRIRRSVSEIELMDSDDNALRQITVSLGVSSLRLEDERIAELIERADRGLYMAKVKGRNQVQWVED